jgi:hypothetical protein
MDTLNFILNKYRLDPDAKSPIIVPNFDRDDLARLFAELGLTASAEIGVLFGRLQDQPLVCNEWYQRQDPFLVLG